MVYFTSYHRFELKIIFSKKFLMFFTEKLKKNLQKKHINNNKLLEILNNNNAKDSLKLINEKIQ